MSFRKAVVAGNMSIFQKSAQLCFMVQRVLNPLFHFLVVFRILRIQRVDYFKILIQQGTHFLIPAFFALVSREFLQLGFNLKYLSKDLKQLVFRQCGLLLFRHRTSSSQSHGLCKWSACMHKATGEDDCTDMFCNECVIT